MLGFSIANFLRQVQAMRFCCSSASTEGREVLEMHPGTDLDLY